MTQQNYKELRLHIHGNIKGADITPLTLPMARLAEYLTDFASLLGHRDHVHFRAIEEGSAAPIALVEIEKEPYVRERVKQAATGLGPSDAMRAYAQLNAKLAEDDGYGEIFETFAGSQHRLIEFPGKRREVSPIFGPFKEAAFVQGELKRVGGQEPTIPVWLEDTDGNMYYCDADKVAALGLAPFLFQQIRVNGMATWLRNENAKWELIRFEIQSYVAPLNEDAPSSIVAKLRSVPDNGWNRFDDPLDELRRLRHGEDEIQ